MSCQIPVWIYVWVKTGRLVSVKPDTLFDNPASIRGDDGTGWTSLACTDA